jgi:glycosyltransferase involved in cell wall biosynthesis
MNEPTDKLFDVFLSYSRTDETWVVRLKSALVERGFQVWVDRDDIQAGERFVRAIESGMQTSAAVALVVSPESISSKWVETEFHYAVQLSNNNSAELPIIPLLLRTAELPGFLSLWQAVNFQDETMFDAGVEKLSAKLQSIRPLQRPQKVCFISSEYPPSIVGGLGIHVQKLTAALARHVKVDVVLPQPSKKTDSYRELADNVRTITMPVDASYDDSGSWCRFAQNVIDDMANRPKSELPDVIHCHDWVTVLAGIKCRWALNIPLVFHVHLPNRMRLCDSIENLGLISADMVIVSSRSMRTEIIRREVKIQNLKVVKNGVDLAVFQPAKDWPEDGGYILIVGRLVEQKGVEYLLRAFSYVLQKFDVRLKIVGDGEYKEWLERLSINLALGSNVEFMPWVHHEKLADLYQRALLVVIPSVFEPFGMVTLEAMACKRAVVASKLGGLRDIVEDGKTGFLVQPKDHLGLAQWIMTLLANSELRNRMGEAGYRRVSTEGYTWPSIAEQVNELYFEVKKDFKSRGKPEGADLYIEQIIGHAPQKDKSDWRSLLSRLFR